MNQTFETVRNRTTNAYNYKNSGKTSRWTWNMSYTGSEKDLEYAANQQNPVNEEVVTNAVYHETWAKYFENQYHNNENNDELVIGNPSPYEQKGNNTEKYKRHYRNTKTKIS